ncbi:unnamed protein product [Dicrocoelium dendriticum]|nr:unnamed protein product [Dicrocoelium dendriticum]
MLFSRIAHDALASENFRRWVEELMQVTQNMSTGLGHQNSTLVTYQSNCAAPATTFGAPLQAAHNSLLPAEPVKICAPVASIGTQPIPPNQAHMSNTQSLANETSLLPTSSSGGQCATSLPTVFKLYGWCPVEIKPDGDCCVAGFYKRHPGEPFSFVKSALVSSVSDDGRTVHTVDERKYLLHEGISWWIYSADVPESNPIELPPHLIGAFSHGFPGKRWRQWTQGLYYLLSTRSNTQASAHETTACNDKAQQFSGKSIPTAKKRGRLDSSPLVDLDLASHTEVDSPKLTDVPAEDSFENQTSPSPSSVTTPVVSKRVERGNRLKTTVTDKGQSSHPKRKLLVAHTNRRTPVRADSGESMSESQGGDSITSVSELEATATSQTVVRHMKKPKNSNEKATLQARIKKKCEMEKRSTGKNPPPRNLLKPVSRLTAPRRLPERPGGEHKVSTNFKLHTASGQTVDSRDLEQTRSGRWVIPRLDRRYAQSIHISKNGVARILHETPGRS